MFGDDWHRDRNAGTNGSEWTMDVVVFTDLCLLSECLTEMLDAHPEVDAVQAVENQPELSALLDTASPDVLLVDYGTAGSVSTIHLVAHQHESTRVVAFSVPETEHHVVECVEAGAASYVPRDGSFADLMTAIRGALRGELYCRPRIAAMLSRRLATVVNSRDYGVFGASLTDREREIVELIEQGLSNKEIAGRLNIRLATVKNHVHNILEKLNVHRREAAAALMHGRGSIPMKGDRRKAQQSMNPST
jgi:DNA-binding NarL/FixJ family response regulator